MTKAESLVTHYSKKELADKVVELSEKLEEMKTVEAQVKASVDTLKSGSPAIGLNRRQDGTFELIKIVYDLSQNAAAIIEKVPLEKDSQISAGKLIKEAGDIFTKASGNAFYK